MKVTLSIPDAVAHHSLLTVPNHKLSTLVTRLLEQEVSEHDSMLAAACHAANHDRALEREIDQWQSFDNGIPRVGALRGMKRFVRSAHSLVL